MAECELFRKTFKRLHDCVQTDVDNFALQLYSKGLVGQGVRDEMYGTAITPSRATAKLLSAVEKKIETNAADLDVFIEALGSNSPWKEVADDLKRELFLIRSPEVRPQLESRSHTFKTRSSEPCLPATVVPHLPLQTFHSQPAPVIHIERLVVTPGLGPIPAEPECVDPVRATMATQPPERPEMPPAARTLVQSPSSQQGSDLVSEERITTASYTSTLTEQGSQPESPVTLSLNSQSSSVSSQSSVCSVTEEEIQSAWESVSNLLAKVQKMEHKLKSKDRKLNALKQERAKERTTYKDGMAAANQENKELHKNLQTLQLHCKELEDQLTVANEAMRVSDQQKQCLLSQLTEYHMRMLKDQERCKRLEAQVKEANAGIEFYSAYQKSEVRAQELESEVEHLKGTVQDYKQQIEVLEVEIEVLVGIESSCSITPDPDLLDGL